MPPLQIPLYAAYILSVNVLLPWWRQPKVDDMPETGEPWGRRHGVPLEACCIVG